MLCSVCCLISYRSFLLLCDIRAAFVLVPTYLPTVTAYPNVDGEEKDRIEIDKRMRRTVSFPVLDCLKQSFSPTIYIYITIINFEQNNKMTVSGIIRIPTATIRYIENMELLVALLLSEKSISIDVKMIDYHSSYRHQHHPTSIHGTGSSPFDYSLHMEC